MCTESICSKLKMWRSVNVGISLQGRLKLHYGKCRIQCFKDYESGYFGLCHMEFDKSWLTCPMLVPQCVSCRSDWQRKFDWRVNIHIILCSRQLSDKLSSKLPVFLLTSWKSSSWRDHRNKCSRRHNHFFFLTQTYSHWLTHAHRWKAAILLLRISTLQTGNWKESVKLLSTRLNHRELGATTLPNRQNI